ncbi:helix-turn-helix domain-containing protein [Fodinicurvata halophila]|uniref:Helix-turn-helix domain-containing protein n=1 Tax=Fodinicurvata halophila TaxID=1419723 RepID=A0ABV8UNB4_9PROT
MQRSVRTLGVRNGGTATASSIPAFVPETMGEACTGERCYRCDVRSQSLCSSLPISELGYLDRIARRQHGPAGATMIHDGAPMNFACNITRGAVRLSRLMSDGRRQVTGFLFPGDFLGLTRRQNFPFNVEAITETEYCLFGLNELDTLARDYPDLRQQLLEMACRELDSAQDQMLLLGRKSALERVSSFLLDVFRRQNRWQGTDNIVTLHMPRGDIADYLGLTIETVSRTLTRLRQDRIIDIRETYSVEILTPQGLQELTGNS